MRSLTVRPNCGVVDRGARLVIGIILLGLYGALEPPLRWVTLLGLPLIATAVTGFCPLYTVLGISTLSAGSDPR
jgi:hypothetical protein